MWPERMCGVGAAISRYFLPDETICSVNPSLLRVRIAILTEPMLRDAACARAVRLRAARAGTDATR